MKPSVKSVARSQSLSHKAEIAEIVSEAEIKWKRITSLYIYKSRSLQESFLSKLGLPAGHLQVIQIPLCGFLHLASSALLREECAESGHQGSLLLLTWSLICWVAMSESSCLHLFQSPHTIGLIFCNLITWRPLGISWLVLWWKSEVHDKLQPPKGIHYAAYSKAFGLVWNTQSFVVKWWCRSFGAGLRSPYTGTRTSSSAALARYCC